MSRRRIIGLDPPERDDTAYVMSFARGDHTGELDEQGVPRPPERHLFCICPPGATEPCGPACPSNDPEGIQ